MNGNDMIELIEQHPDLYDEALLNKATKDQLLKIIRQFEVSTDYDQYKYDVTGYICQELSKIEALDRLAQEYVAHQLEGD